MSNVPGQADHAAASVAHNYGKFIMQIVGAFLTFLLPALVAGNGRLDTSEIINVAVLGVGSVILLNGGELPAGFWSKAKFYISALLAGLVVLQSAFTDGSISSAEWWQIIIAVLTSLGVLAVPGPKVQSVSPGV